MIPELEQDFAEGTIGYWIKQQTPDWQEVIIQRMKEQDKLDLLKAFSQSPLLGSFTWDETIEDVLFWNEIDSRCANIPFSYDTHCKKHNVGKYAEQPVTFAPVTTTATIDGKPYTLEITIKATPNE